MSAPPEALAYAERDWLILPCRPRSKAPCTRNGLKDASTDPDLIAAWWETWPEANVGVACGTPGPQVLDIDDLELGAELVDRCTELGAPIVATARGRQFYFAGTDAGTVGLGFGELRGRGSYVVAPPSIHPSGKTYTWLAEPNGRLPALPDGLVPAPRTNAPAPAIGEEIPSGRRDADLTSLAGTMRRRGMGEAAILAALRVTNKQQCKPPLPEAAVRKIAHSVARYDPAEKVTASLDELDELLGLKAIGKQIDVVKVFGRGSNAVAWIELDNGEKIVLDTIGKFATPGRLTTEVALRTGAAPVFKPGQVVRVLVLLHDLGRLTETFETEDHALDHGCEYLRLTPTQAVTMSDQASRWQAFDLLAHVGRSSGPPEFVLEDTDTGARYVRSDWFATYVRSRVSPGEVEAIGRAMERLGWDKPGRQGRIKATAPGRKGTRIWAFYVVPKGWEDQ